MMNVGFAEASKRFAPMDCVMFHDVDHMLEDDRALMNCGAQPHHYAAAMDEWNYRLEADAWLRRAVGLWTPGDCETINPRPDLLQAGPLFRKNVGPLIYEYPVTTN